MLPQTKNSIKWIKALKSNKFKKGTNTLFDRRENSYCCLGVACRVNNFRKTIIGGFLEHEEKNLLGLRTKHGSFLPKRIYNNDSLASLNDTRYKNSKNFKSIVRHILANIDYLFIPEVASELKIYFNDKKY